MSLENFRKIRIALHDSNDPVLRKLVAKEGDRNGRELEVQLTNRNVLENQTGVTLQFYWHNLRVGNQGIKKFNTVDSSRGLFKVAYPDSMLNAGNVSCYVQIQDGQKITNTRTFTVLVEGSGFDAQTVIASDDYQALNDALIEVNRYQSQISDILDDLKRQGDNLRESERIKFEQLFNDIRPQIDGLEQQFNDAVANLTQDSEVITARTSTETGDSYASLGARLDEVETMTVLGSHKGYFEMDNGQPRIRLEEI